jgi:hypothetical protein
MRSASWFADHEKTMSCAKVQFALLDDLLDIFELGLVVKTRVR